MLSRRPPSGDRRERLSGDSLHSEESSDHVVVLVVRSRTGDQELLSAECLQYLLDDLGWYAKPDYLTEPNSPRELGLHDYLPCERASFVCEQGTLVVGEPRKLAQIIDVLI